VSDSEKQVVAQLLNITRSYVMGGETVHALKDFSFDFRQGEYWAIMGASGSGKSTLLNLLSCIDRPTTGSYQIRGREVSNLSDNEISALRGRELGFIFQSYNLIPQLDVIDNILVPVIYQDDPIPNARERAIELAERVGLKGRLHHRPNQLSGGQQQRVAIARSLINDPAMILADEATGNLDSATAQEILALFDELHASGKTILLVTHEQEVGNRAEHILRLKDGSILSVDSETNRQATGEAAQ
jgi:putative ABC transport system ATP-binding protein